MTYEQKNNRRKSSLDLSTMIYGKVPPQAKELEEAVLAAIMLERNAFETANGILQPGCFYVDANQRIYRAMQNLAQKSMPIDMLTVVEELKAIEQLELVGGPYYIAKITNGIVSSANIDAHSRIVFQKFVQRELIRVSGEIINDAYEDSVDCFELLETTLHQLGELNNSASPANYKHISDAVIENLTRLEWLRNNPGVNGVPTGFPLLDKITCGWQQPDFIILAARPSVGKTAKALFMAKEAAKAGFPVGFFSLEMSSSQLVGRMITSQSGIWASKLKSGNIDEYESKQIYKVGEEISGLPIYINDRGGIDISKLKSEAAKMVREQGVKVIFIDYIQLMNVGRENDMQKKVGTISPALKQLAKDLKIPIIALSQFSREVEKQNRVPVLSDLRESGALEQDADIVIALYQPLHNECEKYGIPYEDRDYVMWKVLKYRNGQPGVTMVNVWNGQNQQECSLEYAEDFKARISSLLSEQPASPSGNWQPVQAALMRWEPHNNDNG